MCILPCLIYTALYPIHMKGKSSFTRPGYEGLFKHYSACVCVLTDPSGCTTGDVRLTGGATNYSGMVELCSGNQWRVICDDTWDDSEATVVCKQLNYPTKGSGYQGWF